MPVYVTIVGLAALPLLLNVLFFTSSEFCGCKPWTIMGMLVALMTSAAVVGQLVEDRHWRAITKVAGYGSLGAVLYLGLGRAVENISRIL